MYRLIDLKADEFASRSTTRAIQRGLAVVESTLPDSSALLNLFRREAIESLVALMTSPSDYREVTRAWTVIDPYNVRYLDLLLFSDEGRWYRWLADVLRTTDELSTVDAQEIPEYIETLRVLEEFSEYCLELPDTPTAWRSISGIALRAPVRVAEAEDLLQVISSKLTNDLDVDLPGAFAEGSIDNSGSEHVVSSASVDVTENPSSLRHSVRPIDVVDSMGKFTIEELGQFVRIFQEKFGVSAIPVAAVEVPPVLSQAKKSDGRVWDSFDVILQSAEQKRDQVIEQLRAVTYLHLSDGLVVIETPSGAVLQGVSEKTALEAKRVIEDAGGTVDLKWSKRPVRKS